MRTIITNKYNDNKKTYEENLPEYFYYAVNSVFWHTSINWSGPI